MATTNFTSFTLRNLKRLVSDGQIFAVTFTKRSTGELRHMRCRTGVKKHLKGGIRAYNPNEHKLLPVFDMDAGGYRSIPIDAIKSLTVGGQFFTFAGGVA